MQEPRPENNIATLLNSALALHRSGGLADALEVYLAGSARAAMANLCEHASSHGIDPDRLIFAGYTSAADHLARH